MNPSAPDAGRGEDGVDERVIFRHFVHLSQAYAILGDTAAAYAGQDDALELTTSPSVRPERCWP
ncbi:hypothetical protein [Streptomyces sp. NPDC059593]|uniref:hypothetical protein n=1 Tax=Streptomyces sp. NPDC059593 TaxID=3346878 RepID=UPI0036A23D6D